MDVDFKKKDERIEEIITRTAANFLSKNLSSSALVTVVDCELKNKGSEAMIFITVLPEDKVPEIMKETKALRSDLREEIKNKTRIRNIPRIDIMIAPRVVS